LIAIWAAILAVMAAFLADPARAAFQSDAPYAFLMDYDTGGSL